MSEARWLTGDVFEQLATLEDGSVDLVLTSPPFLTLRSYLPVDHPDKVKEIGAEPTPAVFVDTLLRLTAEWRRVLAPHGSICVELGDTYSGSGGAGGDYNDGGLRQGQNGFTGSAHRSRHDQPRQWSGGNGWPLAKSMVGIPHLYHLSLAYGRNLLTGEPSSAGEWRIRNVVAWCRPNPPVGALGDKFRPATSYMTIACVSDKRYFDLDAVRVQASPNTNPRTAAGVAERPNDCKTSPDGNRDSLAIQHSHATAPSLDYWEISTQPYSGSHYATWPEALCKRPIEAMCPIKVCMVCGEPSRRITKPTDEYEAKRCKGDFLGKSNDRENGLQGARLNGRPNAEYETTGWTDCGHDAYRRGIVLDPFAGSGTTLQVATGLGRDAIGIDLDARNIDLARERVGMFLTVDEPTTEGAA